MKPILLVHGLGDKNFPFVGSLKRICKHLNKLGYRVYISHQDALGTVANNASILYDEITNIVKEEQVDKIHVIAHSKGGLDMRYAISKYGLADKIHSLTTLATPHYGSELSQRLLELPKVIVKLICWYFNLIYRIIGDKKPDLHKVALELTPAYMELFNERIINDDNVFYQSFAAHNRKGEGTILMFIPKLYQRHLGMAKTDGIVDVEYAKWGKFRGTLGYDHHELAGFLISRQKEAQVVKLYASILEELEIERMC